MKNKIYFAVLFLTALAFALTTDSQGQTSSSSPAPAATPQQKTAAPPQPPKQLDAEFVKFFSGSWSCAGEFADGKKIEADLEFKSDPEGKWLQYRNERHGHISLPGGGRARICTKRDKLPDGREFVGKGVQPDKVVVQTVADFRGGRDTVLEAVIEELKRGSGAR